MMGESEFQVGMKRLERILNESRLSTDDRDASDGRMNVCRICKHVWTSREDKSPRLCPSCRSAFWNSDDLKTVKCFRCGHTWTTSKDEVTRCPNCRSKKWNQKTVVLLCRKCGSRWIDTLRADEDVLCPKCGLLRREDYRTTSQGKETLSNFSEPPSKIILNEDMLRRMWSENDALLRSACLRNQGISAEQADILVQFDEGATAIEIARRMSLPVCDVMRAVLPYMNLCESMGVRSWS